MNKCLYCYKPLTKGERDYHKSCAKKIFGSDTAPLLPYSRENIKGLAEEVVRSSVTVPGVQAKLSIDISGGTAGEPRRFTIVGLWGRFILKPQTDLYPHLPELEDVTMHMAEAAGIRTVPHALIPFTDGELCYITRRIDRKADGKMIAMEDMCQLSERLTEDKYRGSYERIAKLIRRYSAAPLLDLANFWQIVLFSWITGNSDMHLKNFSLYRLTNGYALTPAYDLLSTALVLPADTEELALTLNGRKRKISRADFEYAMSESGLNDKVISNLFKKLGKCMPEWENWICNSFLPAEMQATYIDKLKSMLNRF